MNQERQKTDAIADAVEIPEGATHRGGRYYIKNLRENTPKDATYTIGYIYAYDFFDGKKWSGCVCKAVDFFRIKPI